MLEGLFSKFFEVKLHPFIFSFFKNDIVIHFVRSQELSVFDQGLVESLSSFEVCYRKVVLGQRAEHMVAFTLVDSMVIKVEPFNVHGEEIFRLMSETFFEASFELFVAESDCLSSFFLSKEVSTLRVLLEDQVVSDKLVAFDFVVFIFLHVVANRLFSLEVKKLHSSSSLIDVIVAVEIFIVNNVGVVSSLSFKSLNMLHSVDLDNVEQVSSMLEEVLLILGDRAVSVVAVLEFVKHFTVSFLELACEDWSRHKLSLSIINVDSMAGKDTLLIRDLLSIFVVVERIGHVFI